MPLQSPPGTLARDAPLLLLPGLLCDRAAWARSGAIDCPTLVLCGRQDAWSPVIQHEEIAAMTPGARLVAIDDCGHMSTMEQPERLANAMLDWLRAPMADRATERRWAS